MSNILIIKTSPRTGGNSDALADEFARGAAEAGHNVETVSLARKAIGFCRGCLACQDTHRCVMRDDADAIGQQIHDADVVVWATPVYYYSVSGQMKTMIDRSNPVYGTDYKFRDVYLLASAAEDEPTTADHGRRRRYGAERLGGMFRAVKAGRRGVCRRRQRAWRHSRPPLAGKGLRGR